MDQDLALRIVLVVAGLSILAFGISNEISDGWQLDIVNLITIFGGIVVIVLGIFLNSISGESKRVKLISVCKRAVLAAYNVRKNDPAVKVFVIQSQY